MNKCYFWIILFNKRNTPKCVSPAQKHFFSVFLYILDHMITSFLENGSNEALNSMYGWSELENRLYIWNFPQDSSSKKNQMLQWSSTAAFLHTHRQTRLISLILSPLIWLKVRKIRHCCVCLDWNHVGFWLCTLFLHCVYVALFLLTLTAGSNLSDRVVSASRGQTRQKGKGGASPPALHFPQAQKCQTSTVGQSLCERLAWLVLLSRDVWYDSFTFVTCEKDTILY